MALVEDNSGNWRVGVLFSQTGVTSAIERSQLNATLLAIDEINASGGVLGRAVEPVMYDPVSDHKKFRSFAERLFQVDRIRLLFGCYMSSTRKAVLPVAEAYRGLLFYPTLYEGFEYSRHCVYTGAAPNQNSLQLAKFLLSAYGNRFLFVGSPFCRRLPPHPASLRRSCLWLAVPLLAARRGLAPPSSVSCVAHMGPGLRRESVLAAVSCTAGRQRRWGTNKKQIVQGCDTVKARPR